MLKLKTYKSKGLLIAASLLLASVVVQADTDASVIGEEVPEAIMGIDTEEGGFYYTERTWLGCAVDEQQCSQRASNQGYSWYSADRSFKCPNAAKFGCWGF